MLSLRSPFLRSSRLLYRCTRRQFSGPPPTYPPNNPIHISPGVLERRSPLSTFLRLCVGSAFIGLPGYWILWLDQKVSIPYYVERLDAFQTNLTGEQRSQFAKKLTEVAIDKVLVQLKDSIGLPCQVDPMPSSFSVKAPKIDPTRVIFRIDISRSGISRSQRTFNPADITSWYVNKDIIPGSTAEGEVGYKSLDDVREGFVLMEGMCKVTGPKEMGGRMGTVEFAGIINVETAEIVQLRKVILRVMGSKVAD